MLNPLRKMRLCDQLRIIMRSAYYALNPRPLQDIDQWLNGFRRFWEPKLDALATEITRRKAPDAV